MSKEEMKMARKLWLEKYKPSYEKFYGTNEPIKFATWLQYEWPEILENYYATGHYETWAEQKVRERQAKKKRSEKARFNYLCECYENGTNWEHLSTKDAILMLMIHLGQLHDYPTPGSEYKWGEEE